MYNSEVIKDLEARLETLRNEAVELKAELHREKRKFGEACKAAGHVRADGSSALESGMFMDHCSVCGWDNY